MATLNDNQTTNSEITLESQGVKMINQNPQTVIDANFGKTIFGDKAPTMGNIAKNWSVSDMLERWNLVYTGDWVAGDTTTTELFAITVPWGTLSNSTIRMAFSYFSYWHADISFHVKVSSTRFNQGKMVVFWVPIYDKDYIERYILTNYARVFTLPHVIIDATTMNDATLNIPYNHIKSALAVNVTGTVDQSHFNTLGTLVGLNFNPLATFSTGGGCATDAKISVYCKYVKPTVGPPTRKVNIAPVTHYLAHNPRLHLSAADQREIYKCIEKYAMLRDLGQLQSDMTKYYPDEHELHDVVSQLQSVVDKLKCPSVAKYQSAVASAILGSIVPTLSEAVSGSVGSSLANFQKIIDRINPVNIIANLMPGDRDFPNKNAQEHSFIRHAFGHTANGRQIGHHQRLEHDPTLMFKQSIADLRTTEDEMNLKHLASIPTPLGAVFWRDTDAVGKVLYSTSVAPAGFMSDHTVGAVINPAGYHFITLPFCFWSGSIKFLIKIAVNAMATGRLQIEIQPGYYTPADDVDQGAAIYSYVIDLGNESHDYSFETPYETDTKRKFVPFSCRDVDADQVVAGIMTIRVLNPLRVMCGSPAEAVINVFAAGGETFSLSSYGFGSTDFVYNSEGVGLAQLSSTAAIKPQVFPVAVRPGYSVAKHQSGSDPEVIKQAAEKMDSVADAPPVASREQDHESGELIGIVKTGDSINCNNPVMENMNLLDHLKSFSLVAHIMPQSLTKPTTDVTGYPVWFTNFMNVPGQVYGSGTNGYQTEGTMGLTLNNQGVYSGGNFGYWNGYYIFWSGDLRYKILLSGSSTMNKWRAYAFFTPFSIGANNGGKEIPSSILAKMANVIPFPATFDKGWDAAGNGDSLGTYPIAFGNVASTLIPGDTATYPTYTPKIIYGKNPDKGQSYLIPPMGNMFPLASCDQNAPYMEIEVPFKTIYDKLLVPKANGEIEPIGSMFNSQQTHSAGTIFVVIVSTDANERKEEDIPPTVQIWQAAGDNFRYQTKLGPPTLWTTGGTTVMGSADGSFYPPFPNYDGFVPAPPS